MVAIVSGNSLGLSLSSLEVLGQSGVRGNAAHGRSGERAYVNAATGNLVLQSLDDLLVGRGEDLALLRSYNSQGQMTDDNGDNWSLGTFAQQLKLTGTVMTAGSTLTRTGRDGAQSVYQFDATLQAYVSRDGAGATDQIVYQAAQSRFTWTDGDTQTTEYYDSTNGRLTGVADRAGNTTQYQYNASGTLASLTTSAGEVTHFDYSGTNLTQIRVVTAAGTETRTRYSYDASNRLATVTVDLSPGDNSVADARQYVTSYTYDGTSKRVASITQSDGTSLSFTYVQVGGQYRVASVTDAQGRTTSYSYDTTNRRTTVTDPLGQSTVYAYDTAGQLTQITGPAINGTSQVQSFTYDANGNVTSVVDARGQATTFEYNAQGLPTLERDAAGNTIKRTYGSQNQLLTQTLYVVPDPDGAGTAQATAPLTTRYAYQGQSSALLRFVVSAEGRVTEHRYNAYGQRIATVEYTGAVFDLSTYSENQAPSETTLATWAASQNSVQTIRTDMAYDARGQLQSLTRYAKVNASGAGVADGSQSTTQYVYGRSGELLQLIDAKGGSTTYTYDGMGRQLSVQDAAGQTTLSSYDDANRKTSITQANGLIVTSTHDSAGRLVSVMRTNAANANFGATSYFYDANGRLRMTQDPTGARSWFLYDAAGRKVAEIDGDGSLTEYLYNANNQVSRTIAYATAVNVATLVDGNGQPANVSLSAIRPASSGQDRSSWYAYDSANRLVKTVNPLGVVTVTTYDGASRIVATTTHATAISTATLGDNPSASSIAPAASADDRAQRSFYDQDGLLLATLDAEGYLTEFARDPDGRVIRSTAYATATPAQHRASGTLAQLRPTPNAADVTTHFLLDGKGQTVGQIDAEGYLTENVYDVNGNVTQSIRYATKVAPATIAALNASSTLANVRPSAHASDRVVTRSYDQLNRTAQETNAEGTVTQYSYDSAGRLVATHRAASTADVRSVLARYDLLGRLTGELSPEGAALLTGGQTQAQIDAIWAQYGVSHAYDATGRRTSTTDAVGNRTLFFYDADGRLTHTVNALGETTENQYNALGQLTAQVRFGTRLNTSGFTGSLAGGLVQSQLSSAIDALRNAALDSKLIYTYDQAGQTATVTDAGGYLTSFSRNAFGEETSRTQALGSGQQLVQTRTYDKRGLLTSETLDPSGINAITSAVYDAFGRAISRTDALGRVRQQTYDRLGRIITEADPMAGVHTSSYDAFDRVLTRTDTLGKVTTYSYADANRSVTITTPEGVSVTTVRTRHGQTQSVTDGRGNTTNFAYDKNGNLVSTGTALTTSTQQYDAAGRLSQTVDANGNQVVLTYDAANRLLTRTVDPTGLNLVTTYAYDAKGQQISVTDPNGVVTALAYDLKGQLVRQTVDPTGLNLVTEYAYDGRGKTLEVTRPEGTKVLYVYDKLGRRTQERIDPTGLNLTRSYAYDAKGNVTSATDANGNVTRYAYDANDRQIYSVDPLGNVRFTGYDAEGRITRTVTYATSIATAGLSLSASIAQIQALVVANPARDLVEHRVLDGDGRVTATVNALGEVVKYRYDANGNLIERIGYAARIDMQAWVVGTEPNPAADVARDQRSRTVYDPLNRALYTVDGVGAVVAYTYDGNGNVVERLAYAAPIPTATATTKADIEAAIALVANPVRDSRTRMRFDAANRLSWQVDGVGAVTQRIYDKNGNLAKTIQYATPIGASASPNSVASSANDRITVYVHDQANRLAFTINTLGQLTQLRYDKNGNLKQRIEHSNPLQVPTASSIHTLAATQSAANAARSLTDDRVSHSFYDAADRLVLEVDALGGVHELGYDAAGQRIRDTRYATRIATAGLSDTTTTASVRSAIIANATADRIQRYAYDAAGQLRYAVDGAGYVSYSAFDGTGRTISTTRYKLAIPASIANNMAAIAAALVASPSDDQTTEFSYDAAGRLLTTTDANGKTESHTYDGLGRELSFTNKLGATWTYEHDSAGRMTRETAPQVALATVTADANGNLSASTGNASVVTVLGYDALGNLTTRTEAQGRPEERITRYEYDALGRQVRSVLPAVGVYDAANDNLTTNGESATATRVENTYTPYSQVTYDTFGNAVANRDVTGAMSYKAYDKLGRLAFEIDALGYVTGYESNAWGQVVTTTRFATASGLVNGVPASLSKTQIEAALYPPGGDHSADRKITTDYDQLGQKVLVIEPGRYTYDASSNTSGTIGKTTLFAYNAFGDRVAESLRKNNTGTPVYSRTNYYFDQRGSEVARVDALGYLTTLEHDAWGNLTARRERATAIANWDGNSPNAAPPAFTASEDDRATVYGYDRLNRKVLERRLDVEYTTEAKSTVVTRGNIDTTFTYDDLGNTTSVTDANGATTYTYHDALGRISAIAAPGRSIDSVFKMPLTVFQRDAHGNVLVKTDSFNGASSASVSGFTAGTPSAEDRTELARYDSHGHVVQTQDATGANRYTSYNSRGQIAKEWQSVTDANGVTKTIFKAYKYDALGHQTHIITPATTEVFAGGLNMGYSSAAKVGNTFDEGGNPLTYRITGNNTVSLSWPDLIEGSGGLVRVQVSYSTISTLSLVGYEEYGAPIYDGAASQSTSRTQDFNAASALNGVSLTWAESAAVVGGIASIAYIRVWQQNTAGTWVMKWEGSRAQANGSGVVTVTQAQAGVDEVQMEFNAFGEMTRRGINGGGQEYFTYDNSGALWRTNAEDGIDKVFLFDIQGRRAAEIVSGGSTNLLNFAAASDVDLLQSNDVRRTEYLYDALGRVQSQRGPERLERQGGIAAYRNYVNTSITSSTFMPFMRIRDQPFYGGSWAGTNTISLSWATLEGLGSGDVKVTVDYVTKNYGPTYTTVYDEYGNPTSVVTSTGYKPGIAASTTRVVTADQAKAGISVSWTDSPATYGAEGGPGGVASVSRVRLWKKNLEGNWVPVIDRNSWGYYGNTLTVEAPPNPTTSITLQMRLQGASAWTTQPLTKFDDAYRFDASSLAAGNWEYQVLTTNAGEAERPTSSGTMSLSGGVLSITTALGAVTRSVRPVINQKLDRWGNVLETNDARSINWKTTFRYNANNQVIEQKRPDVNGALSASSPVTSVHYDKLGRQVTSVDANGNVSGQRFDSMGNLEQELNADGGTVTYTYSLFGDKIRKLDARGYTTHYGYDKLSRLVVTALPTVQVTSISAGGLLIDNGSPVLYERNSWDEAGRKISQTNGAGETLKYFYDLQGNLLRTVFPLSQSAKSVYNARGYKTVEVDANGNTNLWKYDYFGLVIGHSDLANNRYSYTYNAARQLIQQTNTLGASKSYSYDRAGQLIQINDTALNQVTKYAYDLAGNRVQENTTRAGVVYQDNHLAYDTLGRLRWVADSRAMVEMWYDKAGNRTRIKTSILNGDTQVGSDRYFMYDAKNRQIVADAVDSAGNLGTKGRSITYDLNDNRIGETFNGTKVNASTYAVTNGTVSESYTYDALNRLIRIDRDGTTIDNRYYDSANRVVRSGGSLAAAYYNALYGANVVGTGSEERTNRYDANGRTTFVYVRTTTGAAKYNLNYSNYDAAGNLLGYTLQNYQGTAYTNTYTYGLLKRDAYKEGTISGTSTYFQAATTTNSYDVNSHLAAVTDSGNAANNRSFVNDDSGRVLYKIQNGAVERQLVANGEVLGRFGGALAEFNFSPTRISATYPQANPGTYAVGAQDSLRSIAKAVYGDSSLWYLIADANGLASDKDMRVGQTLNLPNRVTGASNNAGTFKPYDPSAIVGDTTPTLPSPPPPKKDKGCGGLGQLIMVVVAVVVTIYTAGAMSGATGGFLSTMQAGAASIGSLSAGGMAAASVAGNIASQVVGNVLGVQDGFNWQSVALTAVSAGVTVGMGGSGISEKVASFMRNQIAGVAAQAAVGNALTQGIGVLTGLQKKFDWRGVAASSVGAGVGHGVGDALKDSFRELGNYAEVTRRTAVGLAAGTAAAVVRGGQVVVQQIAIDAFGNALGSSLASQSSSSSVPGPISAEERAAILDMFAKDAPIAPAERASILAMFEGGPGSGASSTYSGGQAWAADVEARRAAAKAGQLDALRASIASSEVSVAPRPGSIYVQPGDSLSKIAARFPEYGSTNDLKNQLIAANPWLADPNMLQEGMELKFPGAGTTVDSAAMARAAGADARYQAALGVQTAQSQRERWDALQSGAWSGRTNQAVVPSTATSASGAVDPFSLVSQDYHVAPGPVSRYYQGQVALFSDSNQPWHVRSLSFVNATLASPLMLFEEGGRGIMNVPYAGSQVGQHAAIFNQATDSDTKVIAGLSMAKFGSEGFVNTYAGGVLGRQVYVQAQDEAVSFWLKKQFDGDIRKFNAVYTSAVDGTRRLGYSFNGVTGYRTHNTEVRATRAGEFMSLERPINPADAIERSALSPLWDNSATELYQVTTRSGFYFKGQVAPQSGWYQDAPFSLGGGNTQVFMPATPNPAGGYPIAPWVPGMSKKVPYGG